MHWGCGIHTVPPPAGQREAGSLRGVAADQAADPRPPAGDRLELQRWQLPALPRREKQPQQGEGTPLPPMGQRNGRAASVSCLRVLALASVTSKSMSYLEMETLKLCSSLFIRWFCPGVSRRREGSGQWWGRCWCAHSILATATELTSTGKCTPRKRKVFLKFLHL